MDGPRAAEGEQLSLQRDVLVDSITARRLADSAGPAAEHVLNVSCSEGAVLVVADLAPQPEERVERKLGGALVGDLPLQVLQLQKAILEVARGQAG